MKNKVKVTGKYILYTCNIFFLSGFIPQIVCLVQRGDLLKANTANQEQGARLEKVRNEYLPHKIVPRTQHRFIRARQYVKHIFPLWRVSASGQGNSGKCVNSNNNKNINNNYKQQQYKILQISVV